MAVYEASIETFALRSNRNGNSFTHPSVDKTFDFSAIPAGAVINSAVLSLGTNGAGPAYAAYNGQKIYITNAKPESPYDVFNKWISANSDVRSVNVTFDFQCDDYSYTQVNICTFSSPKLIIDYTPYTACTPPSSVSAASTDVAPGSSVRLSWSGAAAGTNNPVKSYTVYRSADNVNWSALQAGITNQYLNVTAPTANNGVWYYKVQAIGTAVGYDSVMSAATAQIKCVFSAPSVSAVKLDNGTANVYKKSGTAILSWTGTAGANNTISKYTVNRNGAFLQDVTGTSLTVSVPEVGKSYYYTVIPVGTYSSGSGVNSPTLYTFSDPSAPTTVAVSNAEVGKSVDVTLSWSGAKAGSLNAIKGYRVYRSTSASGTYTKLGNDIASTATSGSLTVKSHSANGSSYYYKVSVIGEHSESAPSAYVRLKTVWTDPVITSIALSQQYAAPGAAVKMTWKGADGTNNPITGYQIFQDGTLIDTVSADTLSYDVTAPEEAADVRSFQVMPRGALSDGSRFMVRLMAYGDPTAPTVDIDGGRFHDKGTKATLTWSDGAGGVWNALTGYRVFRSASPDSGYTQLGKDLGPDAASLEVDVPADMGASWYFKVMTLGTYTNSPMSAYAQLTAQTYTAPAAPAGVSVSPEIAGIYDSPVLSWSVAEDGENNPVTGYAVYRSASANGTYTELATLGADAVSMPVTAPPTMGASWYFRVYALAGKTGFTRSAASEAVRLTSMVYTAPSAPGNVSVSAPLANAGTTVTILWDASADGQNDSVDHYEIYRDTGSGFALFRTTAPDVLSVEDTVGDTGKEYYYRIRAVGAIPGFESEYSRIVSVVSNSPPGLITDVTALPAHGYYEPGDLVTIFWKMAPDPDDNVAQFEVQSRSQYTVDSDFDPWAREGYIPAKESKTVVYMYAVGWSVHQRGTRFQFRIRAIDSLGLAGEWYGPIEFKVNRLPSRPTLLYPPWNATTYNQRPFIVFGVSRDQDGHEQTLEIQVDDEPWREIRALGTSYGTMSLQVPDELSVGEMHLIKLRIRDSVNTLSKETWFYIFVDRVVWAREIHRGDIISKPGSNYRGEELTILHGSYNGETVTADNGDWSGETLLLVGDSGTSHQYEINQMFDYVNTGRVYYGLDPITVSESVGEDYANAGAGKIGMYAAWGDQMKALYDGLTEIAQVKQARLASLTIRSGMMPTASIVNAIREAIENM